MQAVGSIGPQYVGQLAHKIGRRSVVVTVSFDPQVADQLDPSSFIVQLRPAAGEPQTRELPSIEPETFEDETRFQWVLADTAPPASAQLSAWHYDGTRFDLELSVAVSGAA